MGDPYFPLDGNGGYDVKHYDLDLSYDPETDVLAGDATIEARATQHLSSVQPGFRRHDRRVRSASTTERPTWARDGQELTITPTKGIQNKAKFTVAIAYHGIPEAGQRNSAISGFMHTNDGAVIVGEPHVAATWFPANDHPTDKASFTFHWTVPEGHRGRRQRRAQRVRGRTGGWTTWTWDARRSDGPYLATASIGQLEIDAYKARGLPYWDAIDPALFEPPSPPPSRSADRWGPMLFSQATRRKSASYKRLTRVLTVPSGGATLSFDTFHDTEPGLDFLFVEKRTAGGDDWTTLEEQGGHHHPGPGCMPGDPLRPPVPRALPGTPPEDAGAEAG